MRIEGTTETIASLIEDAISGCLAARASLPPGSIFHAVVEKRLSHYRSLRPFLQASEGENMPSEYERLKAQSEEIQRRQLYEQRMSEPVYGDIRREREHQQNVHGGPVQDDKLQEFHWKQLIEGYVSNLLGTHRSDYRENMVKIAALAVAAIESYDRTHVPPTRAEDIHAALRNDLGPSAAIFTTEERMGDGR